MRLCVWRTGIEIGSFDFLQPRLSHSGTFEVLDRLLSGSGEKSSFSTRLQQRCNRSFVRDTTIWEGNCVSNTLHAESFSGRCDVGVAFPVC